MSQELQRALRTSAPLITAPLCGVGHSVRPRQTDSQQRAGTQTTAPVVVLSPFLYISKLHMRPHGRYINRSAVPVVPRIDNIHPPPIANSPRQMCAL